MNRRFIIWKAFLLTLLAVWLSPYLQGYIRLCRLIFMYPTSLSLQADISMIIRFQECVFDKTSHLASKKRLRSIFKDTFKNYFRVFTFHLFSNRIYNP